MPAPNVPNDIMDRLDALERQLRELSGRVNIRPALSEIKGGGVTISQGGTLAVVTPGNQQALYVGAIGPNHPDGSPQYGTVLRREDGTAALAVWDPAGASPQPINVWDHAGNVVFADDRVSGQGLARPYIEGAGNWFGAVEQPTFVTSSTTFVTVTMAPWFKQHPKLQGFFLVRCSDGTTSGEIQLTDDAGTAISPVLSVTAGSFYYGSTSGPVAGAHESQTYLRWKARVLPGSTGTIGVKGLATYGVQS